MLLADVPVEIGRDEAQRAARTELSDPAYDAASPGPLVTALDWLADRLADLFSLVGAVPGGPGALVLLVLLLVLLVLVVRLRAGRLARHGRRRSGAVFSGTRRSAADHRAAADGAWSRGELADAVRERFRAIVRDLEERGVLDERPGRTADEAAADAARGLPDAAGELRSAALLFDAVHYGGAAADEDDCLRLAALDERLRASRPVSLA
ncbi:DUF4129 domain-containing protein [Qaidamihabitans albus]|uniref:DUF4129 domain-containing protein n=1 Tax=Qaidamihabitans albus TaxID=2795733 RepID=UPI0018F1E991|nr:DUF4129 domain-containing protein [Qaidamihabitans albus]